jgi:acyl carrier protein
VRIGLLLAETYSIEIVDSEFVKVNLQKIGHFVEYITALAELGDV